MKSGLNRLTVLPPIQTLDQSHEIQALTCIIAMTLFSALAIPVQVTARGPGHVIVNTK